MGISCFSVSTSRAHPKTSNCRVLGRAVGTTVFCAALFCQTAHANLEGNTWIFHHQNREHAFGCAGDIRGSPFVCLDPLIKKFGLRATYHPENFELHLLNPSNRHEARLRSWSREVQLQRRQNKAVEKSVARLSRRPEFMGVRLCVPIDFGDRVLRPLLGGPLAPLVMEPAQAPKAEVVIDPGHGGNDYGARLWVGARLVKEKDLVLAFAQELAAALQKEKVSVLLTRREDSFLTLPERSLLANASGARLFVSLHMNADATSKAKGFEVYVLSLTADDSSGRAAVARENQVIPSTLDEGMEKAISDLRAQANLEASLSWAGLAQKTLLSTFRPSSSRSIRMGPFYLLYGALMPSMLLELGYITHPDDRNLMEDAAQRRKLARTAAQKISVALGKVPN